MLTLAAILVLYYVAEVVGANGAITILLFGLVLGNMESLAGRLVRPLRVLIGYELDRAKFVLDEFLRRINEELSFLVRTFFYVLLGLIVDLSQLTWTMAGWGLAFFGVIFAVRIAVTYGLGTAADAWSPSERVLISAMMPRGVATAVMAFLPASAGIPETEQFPSMRSQSSLTAYCSWPCRLRCIGTRPAVMSAFNQICRPSRPVRRKRHRETPRYSERSV